MLGRCGALNKGRASALASSLRASRHFACGSAWHTLGAGYIASQRRDVHMALYTCLTTPSSTASLLPTRFCLSSRESYSLTDAHKASTLTNHERRTIIPWLRQTCRLRLRGAIPQGARRCTREADWAGKHLAAALKTQSSIQPSHCGASGASIQCPTEVRRANERFAIGASDR